MKRNRWSVPLLTVCCVLAVPGFGVALGQVLRPAPIALTHVTVIDMTGAAPKPDMTVVVEGDRIAAIGRSSQVRPPKGAQIVDARHKYLIPGFWDMHAHNFFGSNPGFYSLYIANGVTGVRDMGGLWKDYDAFRQEQREGRPLNGKWPAPHIVAAGVILDGKPPAIPTNVSVTNPTEARQAVDLCKRRGVDFIKVYSVLNRPSYFAIASEAKKDGLPYAGHVTFFVSAAEASDAGQKSIEHNNGILLACSTEEHQIRERVLNELATKGYSFGLYMKAEYLPIDSYSPQKAAALFARFVKNGTWICPTLIVEKRTIPGDRHEAIARLSERYVPHMVNGFWKAAAESEAKSFTPEDKSGVKQIYQSFLTLVGAMNRAGVPLLAGSDTPNPWVLPGFSLREELALLVQAGLTPMQALQAATINPARFLGKDTELGTVQKEKLADLVLLDANPLADIHNTTKIDAVFANGRYLSHDDLQQMLDEVAASAKKGGPAQ
jgi:Amidohydrolase family